MSGVLVGDLRRMWALLGVSRWRVVVAVGWGVLALGSGLGLAALAAWLIARAWQMPPVLDLSIAVVTVRALGISRGLCRYLERLATHDVALRAMTTARTTVYRTLARSDFWLYRPTRSKDAAAQGASAAALRRGDLLVRTGSDIDDLGAVVVRVFVPVAVAVVLSAVAIGLLATISVAAAAILAGALALSGLVAPWLSARAARDAERAVRADRAEFTAQSLTVLDHAAELRVAGRLDAALAAAVAASRRAVAAEDQAAARSAWSAAATPLAIGASVLGALLIGITLYGPSGGTPGAMTPMALTILMLLPLSAFEAVGPLPAAAQSLTTARAALHRLTQLDEMQDERHTSAVRLGGQHIPQPVVDDVEVSSGGASGRGVEPAGGQNVLGAESVEVGAGRGAVPVRARDSSDSALAQAVSEIPAGRRVAVVGPSGSGKTTLLMRWAGLFDTPRPGVTFFAEDAHLFGTSVLENLRVGCGDLSVADAEKALRTVGLGEWLAGLADGVHTDLVGGAAAVSGGQRRRILLARALVSPARVLLLDEPTEHLEADAGAQLLRELLDAESGLVEPDRIVVVVTHQLPGDHRADAIVRVDASGQVTTHFPGRPGAVSAHREIPLPTR
ncbi:ABC transporter permease/ATP-binding protein CydC [Nocardia brasiliensis NBRC 14402]|uniref:thiol reductant ABC exporter subunit CydC n=1 Tax=Nocardia brasiliensis TaxID=37326 RepID=UPI0002E11657|nr:thiol reductant ABC exporter subunit CydC [Nocardia brasiliensis]AVL26447.1 thiol reductant ABC exporter subunit CydC [Nocardia brasiliensis]GAJ85257.1 ABC transporter permease/ATP-binding protein CydC [Nocardia brasiliensis NBRC 14402]SUB11244.1 Probable ABC transporter ATP-binding protein HI_0664 [Nocardia brasiliensis]